MYPETVSVIIPYYRASRTIARAVRSVLAQTVSAHEIIVVDDGSPDDAASATKEFGSAVTVIRKPNGGTASARNLGIEHATGHWIAFLDADDYWEPFRLERQLAVSEGVGLVGGMWFEEYSDHTRFIAAVSRPDFFGKIVKATGSDAFYVAMNCSTIVILVRRTTLGEHRFVTGLEPAEDRDLWIRLITSTSVYLVPEALATYVQYSNSLSNSDPDRDCASMLRVVHRHALLLGPSKMREQEAIVYRRWASRHLATGKARSAIAPAAHRLAIQPTSAQAWWIMYKSLARSIFS